MEDSYTSKCHTMSHRDIMTQKRAKKGLTCQHNSVTDDTSRGKCYATQKCRIAMGMFKEDKNLFMEIVPSKVAGGTFFDGSDGWSGSATG